MRRVIIALASRAHSVELEDRHRQENAHGLDYPESSREDLQISINVLEDVGA